MLNLVASLLKVNDMIDVDSKKDTNIGHAEKKYFVLDEFGVKSDNELMDVLLNDWNLVKCKCGNKFDLTTCNYSEIGNPICNKCGRSQ